MKIFKKEREDFVVTERLPFVPSGEGEALYFFAEKSGKNTMDIVGALQKKFGLARAQVGIAGLKDKEGITRQRRSFWDSAVAQCGGPRKLENFLAREMKILAVTRHEKPLQIGQNAGNSFQIRLRFGEKIADERFRKNLEKDLQEAKNALIPNCFGVQRFGRGLRNFKRAKEILENPSAGGKDFELAFKLQSYASYRFNSYAMSRWEAGLARVDGDILLGGHGKNAKKMGLRRDGGLREVPIADLKSARENSDFFVVEGGEKISEKNGKIARIETGPMLGWNLPVPPRDSDAGILEWDFFGAMDFWRRAAQQFAARKIFGLRRPLWVVAEDLQRHRTGADLELQFFLPTGSYATVVLGVILAGLGEKILQENLLTLPWERIPGIG